MATTSSPTEPWQDVAVASLSKGSTEMAAPFRAALKRSRSLNGPREAPWKSVAVDWLRALRHDLVSASWVKESLEILLEEGLEPNGGAASFTHLTGKNSLERQREYLRLTHGSISRQATDAKRIRYGAPLRGHETPAQFMVSWLGKVIYEGRHRPDLPELVEVWLRHGADPSDQPHYRSFASSVRPSPDSWETRVEAAQKEPWSAWPTALCSGHLPALRALALGSPPSSRPPDWAVAVNVALGYANKVRPEQARDVLAATAWFVETYPPLDHEMEALRRLECTTGAPQKRKLQDPAEFLLGLSLPLRWPEVPLDSQAPQPMNPWLGLCGVSSDNVDAARRVLDRLLQHPHWGTREGLASSRMYLSGASEFCQSIHATAVDAWALMETSDSPELISFQKDVLALADRWAIPLSQDFPALLAASDEDNLSSASTVWLKERFKEWSPCPQTLETPWHHAPKKLAVMDWLVEQEVPVDTVSSRGESGLARALATFLVDGNVRNVNWVGQYLVSHDVDGKASAGGYPLKSWISSVPEWRSALVKANKMGIVSVDADDLAVATALLSLHSVRELKQKAGGMRRFSQEEKQKMVAAWSNSKEPRDHGRAVSGSSSVTFFRRRAAVLKELGKSAFELGVDMCSLPGWWSKVSSGYPFASVDDRVDLDEAWDFLKDQPPAALTASDKIGLAQWIMRRVFMHHNKKLTKRVISGALPWESPTWKRASQEDRSALARLVFRQAWGHFRSPMDDHFRSPVDDFSCVGDGMWATMLECLVGDRTEDLLVGASSKEVDRLLRLLSAYDRRPMDPIERQTLLEISTVLRGHQLGHRLAVSSGELLSLPSSRPRF